MIKTYEEFICEGKSFKKVDFAKQYSEMTDKCLAYIIEFVKANDSKVEVEPTEVLVYGGDRPLFKNGGVVAEFTEVKVTTDEDSPYATSNGDILVITTKDGKDFPVDVETVPYDTIFAICQAINEA